MKTFSCSFLKQTRQGSPVAHSPPPPLWAMTLCEKMTKITYFASSGLILLKIRQRCGFLPEIRQTKIQLSTLNGWKVINMPMCPLRLWNRSQPFQSSTLIMDIATYRLNQPLGQCCQNHLKCIIRWEGRDGVTITIFFQHTMVGHKTSYL